MRWPLMFRSTHDALVAAKDREIALASVEIHRLHTAVFTERERHDAFVALVAERSAPDPKPVPLTQEPDPVSRAVMRKAGGNTGLRSHLFRFAAEERARGADDATIERRILDWSSPANVATEERDRAEAEAQLADLLG